MLFSKDDDHISRVEKDGKEKMVYQTIRLSFVNHDIVNLLEEHVKS